MASPEPEPIIHVECPACHTAKQSAIAWEDDPAKVRRVCQCGHVSDVSSPHGSCMDA